MQLEDQLHERRVEAVFTTALREHLAKEGFDPLMGARPMQRLIQDTIRRRALADELLLGRRWSMAVPSRWTWTKPQAGHAGFRRLRAAVGCAGQAGSRVGRVVSPMRSVSQPLIEASTAPASIADIF